MGVIEKRSTESKKKRLEAEVAEKEKSSSVNKDKADTEHEDLRKVRFKREDSYASDDTAFEHDHDPDDDDLDIRIRREMGPGGPYAREHDHRGIRSVDSFHERYVLDHYTSINNHAKKSYSNFIDTKEVFEEWTLRWFRAQKQQSDTKSIFGIECKRFFVLRAVWARIPETRSQDELRKSYSILASQAPESKRRASVLKTIKKLPRDGRESLEELVEDRQRATSNIKFKRQWSIVQVEQKTRHQYGGSNFFKSVKDYDWRIVLKGETVDQADRNQPNIWSDPWRKSLDRDDRGRTRRWENPYYHNYSREPNVRPYRPQSPSYVRQRSFSPVGRARAPVRVINDRRERDSNIAPDSTVVQPGTIFVSQIVNVEEAEKKMDEILKDLPGFFTP